MKNLLRELKKLLIKNNSLFPSIAYKKNILHQEILRTKNNSNQSELFFIILACSIFVLRKIIKKPSDFGP